MPKRSKKSEPTRDLPPEEFILEPTSDEYPPDGLTFDEAARLIISMGRDIVGTMNPLVREEWSEWFTVVGDALQKDLRHPTARFVLRPATLAIEGIEGIDGEDE